jgi:uncharacterized protein YdeI (YjbR/CyaY-like superfamily)
MTRDPRVDAYISRQADFARPILEHLRATIHSVCPQAEETLKWSMPAFLYKGKILASMAAFKAHAAFGFWRSSDVLGDGAAQDAMGQFGKLNSVEDLPTPDALCALILKAMSVIDSGPAAPKPKKPPKPELPTPDDLRAAMARKPAAAATFDAFPPSCRREYVEWVIEAKRPETREKRISQTVEWLAEGKRRNWKYENC